MELVNKPYLLIYVVGYFIIMLIIGQQSSKKIHNSEDFVLAGRSLGPLVLMGTMLATYTGGGTITGGGNSLSYNNGIWSGIFFCLPALITIVVLYLISGKIRAMGKYTVSEILEEKYGKEAKILASIIIMLAFVGILSYQYKGLAFVLNVTTGISVPLGIIISAALIIILTTMGGLVTVAYTDAISASLILISVVIAVPISIAVAGGWSNVVANSTPTSLTLSSGLNFFQFIGNYLPLLILGLGDQNMYQRIVAAKGGKDAKIGMLGWFIGILIVMPCVAVIAFVSKSIFGDTIQAGMALISITTVLPSVLGGILLAGSTAFIVTTGTSYLMSASTNVTYDIYTSYINKNATDKQKLIVTRFTVPILGAFAFIIINFFPSVLAVQMYSYTIYGAGITPAVLAALLWKRVNKKAGFSSMIVGTIGTLIWEIILKKPHGLNSALISFPIALATLIIITLLTTKKGEEVKQA